MERKKTPKGMGSAQIGERGCQRHPMPTNGAWEKMFDKDNC